ncbi:MAG: PorT family protein [Cyclobacteriaceae bacterium]|nr:PorT family protein [Cyclobacteriaceae bacterium]
MKAACIYVASLTAMFTFRISHAQVNSPYESGYVVLTSGDTVRGLLKYYSWRDLYSKVEFKGLTGKEEIYYPGMIRSFYSQRTENLFISSNYIFKRANQDDQRNSFFRVLIEGRGTFYVTQNTRKQNVYYAAVDSELVALRRKAARQFSIEGGVYNKNFSTYATDLKKLFKECYKDSIKEFNVNRIKRSFVTYNSCKSANYRNYDRKRARLKLGYTFGYSSSTLTFKDLNATVKPYQFPALSPVGQYELGGLLGEVPAENSFVFGVTVTAPTYNKFLTIESQFLVSSRRYQSTSQKFNASATYLEVPLYLKYNVMPRKKLQPFVSAGITFALPIGKSLDSQNVTRVFGSGKSLTRFYVPMPSIIQNEYRPAQFRYLLSGGIDWYLINDSKVTFGYRYESGGSITQSPIYETNVTVNTFSLTFTPKPRL